MTNLDLKDGDVVLAGAPAGDPSKADEMPSHATEHGMRQRPAFISAKIQISLDPKHVANRAKWRAKADNDIIVEDSAARPDRQRAAEIAEPTYGEPRGSRAA